MKNSDMSPIGPLRMSTWPSKLKGIPVPQWFEIWTDHMLVGSEWEAGPLEVGPKITSDHRPIRTRVWLRYTPKEPESRKKTSFLTPERTFHEKNTVGRYMVCPTVRASVVQGREFDP